MEAHRRKKMRQAAAGNSKNEKRSPPPGVRADHASNHSQHLKNQQAGDEHRSNRNIVQGPNHDKQARNQKSDCSTPDAYGLTCHSTPHMYANMGRGKQCRVA